MTTVDLQTNHPNGSILRVLGVQLASDHTAVKIAATNGFENPIRLNRSRDMILQDSLGNRYNVAAPADNQQITIAPGATVEGTFNFMGRMNPGATSATLITNEKLGNEAFERSVSPKMSIAIPLAR